MDAEQVLCRLIAETDAPLARAEADLREAQKRVEQIQAERYGLELALARHRGQPAPPVIDAARQPAADSANWLALGRTDAAERVLREAGTAVHRKAIHHELHRHGRDDSIEAVSAALAYLNRKGRIVSKGGGMWIHSANDQPQPAREALDVALEAPSQPSGVSGNGNDPAPTGSFLEPST